METVLIREFFPQDSRDDKDVLLPAFLEIWNADSNLRFLSFTMKPFDMETVRFWLENHKDQGGRYFGAVDGEGGILGIAVVSIRPTEGIELLGLGVRPEFKRQGIGRRLVACTVNQAVDLDFNAVDASVFADNAPMLRLLLSEEFIPVNMDFRKRSDGTDIVRTKRYL